MPRRGIRLIQRLFGRGLVEEASQVLRSYSGDEHLKQEALVREFAHSTSGADRAVSLGTTSWGEEVSLAAENLVAHSLIVGATGAGKSYVALSLINQLLAHQSMQDSVGFGVFDAKGELFQKTLRYLYAHLYRLTPAEREMLAKRIVIFDFSDSEVLAPYNILARRKQSSDELLVADRLDTISEQFTGLSEMSVRMRMIAQHFFLLMVEFGLPLTFFESLCADPPLLLASAEKSQHERVRNYFRDRFSEENSSTILALRQRIDSLLLTESVRLCLSASSSPDFAALQDERAILLINTAGPNISRGTSKLLQSFILGDITQSVFRRSNTCRKFLWVLDEAQEIYKTPTNRESMITLLTMARSFGSFFVQLTQSVTSAVRDADVLNSILANVRWVLMLRSTLQDASLIAPAIPVTRTMLKPKRHPYEHARYMTEGEELKAILMEVTKLPDREAYLWLKGQGASAIKLRTPYVLPPHIVAGCSEEALDAFAKERCIGRGIKRAEMLKQIAQHHHRLHTVLTPHTPAETHHAISTERTSGHSVLKVLEEEYAKKGNLIKRD